MIEHDRSVLQERPVLSIFINSQLSLAPNSFLLDRRDCANFPVLLDPLRHRLLS